VAIGEILGQLRGETECQTTAESGIIDDCEKVIGLLNSTLATTRLPRKKNGEFDKHPIGTCQVQIHYKGDWADSCVSTWKAMIIPLNIMMNKCKDETNVGAFVEIGGDSCPATLDIVRADRPTAAS
jgi:hypothetical protein